MEAVLEAQARDTFGKNEARRTRRGGHVPGVLYGGDGKGATPIAVQPKALLQITIPIIVHGEPKGVKQQGGILEFIRREIVIEVLPADIPEHVDVDVSELMLHQGVRVRDIATNPKWKPISDLDMMLVHVILPKAEEVVAPAEAAAVATATPAEPEVIKKGKKEEEEAEKDDKKKEVKKEAKKEDKKEDKKK